jgi:hypothetical protein
MCGRFSQSMTREEYLAILADEAEKDIPYDPEPIGRYNVAPGTKVLLLSERDEQLHLDPVFWGYAPGWWDKPPLINARVETAATSRMFKPSGSMGVLSALPMAGLSGKRKATRSSHISSTAPMANQYLWRRSEVHHSNAVTKLKGF